MILEDGDIDEDISLQNGRVDLRFLHTERLCARLRTVVALFVRLDHLPPGRLDRRRNP